MGNFKLNKKVKGKVFEYTVTNEKGEVVSKRMSARDYVACTANGEFYFGRLDLIGSGEHGRQTAFVNKVLSNPEKYTYDSGTRKETPEEVMEKYKERLEELNQIAYLES